MTAGLACRVAVENEDGRWHDLCAGDECECCCHLRRWRIRSVHGYWTAARAVSGSHVHLFATHAQAIAFVDSEIRGGAIDA